MATVLHIGFHKTGTTTLQQEFFRALEGCTVLSANSRDVGEEFHRRVRELASASDEDYSDASLRDLIARRGETADVLVVSHEDLSQWSAHGRTAARLQDLLPHAKILICVREQRSMLYARYGQYVKKGGSHSFARYLAKFDEEWMRYDLTVEDYMRRWGADRVKVALFEQLVRSPQSYFEDLRAFIVVDGPPTDAVYAFPLINRTLAPPTRWVVRVCNRLFVPTEETPRPPLRRFASGRTLVRKLMKRDPVWFPKMSRQLGRRARARAARYVERYAGPNARLEELTGLSLAEFDYLIATASLVDVH